MTSPEPEDGELPPSPKSDQSRFKVLELTNPVLRPPETGAWQEVGVVVDCRKAAHDAAVKNVSVVAELLRREEVKQVLV